MPTRTNLHEAGDRVVFISSTSDDLTEHRAAAEHAAKLAGFRPEMMEYFGASGRPSLKECLDRVGRAHVVVVISAHRYGWVPEDQSNGDTKSITWLECEHADREGAEVLAFVVDDAAEWAPELFDKHPLDEALANGTATSKLLADVQRDMARLRDFNAWLSTRPTVTFRSKEDLTTKVVDALHKWRGRHRQALTSEPPGVPALVTPSLPDLDIELARYRKAAESLHAYLPVAGFQTQLRVPIRVDELYVPLRAVADLRGVGEAEFADAEDAERKMGGATTSLEVPATEAFAAAETRGRHGVVLLGDPGSGKTTHLKRVLLWVLTKGPETLGLPPDMVPVFLPLRDLRDLDSGLERFIEAQLDHPHLEMLEGFGRRLLSRGNLLLLFDGLDEVSDIAHRQRVAAWIDRAAEVHSTCRCLISCRFAGYSRDVRLSERFLEMHLRPLAWEQAESFVQQWYRIVETGLAAGTAGQAEAVARDKASDLLGRLREPDFRARRVFELTRNPLLLANLCLVHRDRGRLPHRRADLYGECVDVLLERWRAAKQLKTAVTAKDGRRVLQPAAYWLHGQDGRTRATADELAPVIEPTLRAIRWDGGTTRDFLARIRDESGLLIGWDQERYGFMHLGFQEYLAAREIRRLAFQDPSVLRDLARHHGQSWWQEVALLLVALEEPSLFESYLGEVVDQPAFAAAPAALDALLEDAAEVSDGPFLELAGREPGTDTGLWARQLLALRILARLGSDGLEPLQGTLARHPSPKIQGWLRERRGEATRTHRVTAHGAVELVEIPAGHFQMGSPDSEAGRYDDEGPQHRVSVPAVQMGRYAVTNEEFARFLAAHPDATTPHYWSDRRYNQARQPVVGIGWEEARRFAGWVGGRLPTEAEWEYAARAGTTEPYLIGSTRDDLNRFGWHAENAENRLHHVGEKEPNAWGLHDVLGNVWEWTEDDWHATYKRAPDNGSAWVDTPRADPRVVRGGSFYSSEYGVRAAYRFGRSPGYRALYLGFRVVVSPFVSDSEL